MARSRKQNPEADTPPEENGIATAALPVAPDTTPELPATTSPGNGEKKRPVESFSYPCGGGVHVKASIWDRQIEIDGRSVTVYSVTLQKSYRDTEGKWQNTTFLRGSEIHVAIYALQKASDWILDQRVEKPCPF